MIEIWTAAAATDQAGELERCCLGWLTVEERERADRFRVATSRHQHVVGRGMARYLLADWVNRPRTPVGRASSNDPTTAVPPLAPSQIELQFSGYGKPSVAAPGEAVRPFNVAHTDAMVICAIRSQDSETVRSRHCIGVDVERVSRRTDLAIADRYFATPEVVFLHQQTDPQAKLLTFLKIWTLKEAFIKAVGMGLSIPLADFAFEQIETERPTVRWLDRSRDDGVAWHFATFSPAPGYLAAVAWNDGDANEFDFHWHRFEDRLPTRQS